MPLSTSTLRTSFTTTQTSQADLITRTAVLNQSYQKQLAYGTDSNEVNLLFTDTRTLTTGANEDLDLSGTLTDAFSNTLTFGKVKAIYVKAHATNTTNITVSPSVSNGFVGPFGSASDSITLYPGDEFYVTNTDSGWAVASDTRDLLNVANSAGASGIYDVLIFGTEAAEETGWVQIWDFDGGTIGTNVPVSSTPPLDNKVQTYQGSGAPGGGSSRITFQATTLPGAIGNMIRCEAPTFGDGRIYEPIVNTPNYVSAGGEIWCRYYMRLEPEWDFRAGLHALKFFRFFYEQDGSSEFIIEPEGNPPKWSLFRQGVLDEGGGSTDFTWWGAVPSGGAPPLSERVLATTDPSDYDFITIPHQVGQWECHDFYIKLGTTNAAGIVRFWRNQKLIYEVNVRTQGSAGNRAGYPGAMGWFADTWDLVEEDWEIFYLDKIIITTNPSQAITLDTQGFGTRMIGPI